MFDDFERSFFVVVLFELLLLEVVVVGGQIRKYDIMKKKNYKLKKRPKR